MALHARTHPTLDVPGCFGCKAASVRVSADAMPFRKAETAVHNIESKRLAKDGAAYRRMVKNGVQPKTFVGAAVAEQMARTKDEAELMRPLPGDGNLRPDLLPQ